MRPGTVEVERSGIAKPHNGRALKTRADPEANFRGKSLKKSAPSIY